MKKAVSYKCFAPLYQKSNDRQRIEHFNEIEAAITFTKINIKDVLKNVDANFLDVSVENVEGKTTVVRVTAHRETSTRMGISEPPGTVLPVNVKIVFKAKQL